jgi:methyltransferase family protein
MKARLKELLGPRWRQRARKLSRLRWLTKLRQLRYYDFPIARRPLFTVRYLLFDPEVDNFTYEIENEDELVEFLAGALGVDRDRAAAYVAEARSDEELTDKLSRRVRWRWDMKRRLHLGRRLGLYAIARELKPGLAVEAGIQDGLGSLVLLRALEHNAQEGHPGRLISFDILPGGWLVPDRLRPLWTTILESTTIGLEPALSGLQVDMIVHDSGDDYERERHEYVTALAHAGPRLALVSNSGFSRSRALPDVCAALGVKYQVFGDRPKNHFYPGGGLALGLFDRELHRDPRDALASTTPT